MPDRVYRKHGLTGQLNNVFRLNNLSWGFASWGVGEIGGELMMNLP